MEGAPIHPDTWSTGILVASHPIHDTEDDARAAARAVIRRYGGAVSILTRPSPGAPWVRVDPEGGTR